MPDFYKIHFGFSKSKRYPQALELAKLANKHEIRGEGEDIWHIVTFKNEQIDLMASFYKIAKSLSRPKIYGIDIISLILYLRDGYKYFYDSNAKKNFIDQAAKRLQTETKKNSQELANYLDKKYLQKYEQDMSRVIEKLQNEGFFDSFNHATMKFIKATKKPEEALPEYRKIRGLIENRKYEEAINSYYNTLGNNFYGELHNELIYLKRLAKIPLTGRDLLYFRSESSRDELVNSNLSEYCLCIDKVLEQYQKAGLNSPLEILINNAPTMEELIEKRKEEWHGIYLWNGKYQRDNTQVTIDSFSPQYDKTPEGRLFDKYPDQVQYCRIIEISEDKRFKGLWTSYSPSYYKRYILNKGYHLNGIEAYEHKLWKRGKREPDFKTVKSFHEIKKSDYGTNGIQYTGRSHKINEKEYYEINILRKNMDSSKVIGNPFTELVEEILREAENLLRENHNLPRIGEGWFSEMQLYNLIKGFFPEAEHLAIPQWLKPLHLDIYVSSEKLAFEYQGKQHFEAIEFFGGEKAFNDTQERDQRKRMKCQSKGVTLIEWRYDEPINPEVLEDKLKIILSKRKRDPGHKLRD
jgi:hypothetical protein